MNGENQALGSALNTNMQPAAFREPDYSKIKTLPQNFAEQQRVANEVVATRGELKRAELEQAANLAGEQYKAAKGVADEARTKIEEMHAKEAEFPYPEFHPTRDNAQSLAGLFSIVSMLGVALGNTGKQSALNAMSAMTGMMNGWQKGRADLFKNEKENFDKEFNRIKTLRESLHKDIEDYMKLLPYDKEAAMYKAAEISAKTGSESIINAYVKNGRPEAALQLLKEQGKAIQHEEDKRAKLAEVALRASEKNQRVTQQQFIVQRTVNSLGGVASALETINQLPAGTTTGILPNLTTKDGMTNYLRNYAGRTVSKPEAKSMETLFTGITRNLATIESSGTAMGLVGLASQLEKLRPVAGDTAFDVALKMADIRRVATENVQPLIDSGLMPPAQQQTAAQLIQRIDRAIPYTTMDVVNAIPMKGRKTASEAAQEVAEKGRLSSQEQQRLRELEAKEKEQ